MKDMKSCLLILLIFVLMPNIAYSKSLEAASYNSVRVARWQGLDIDEGFLSRIKNAGYNYVLVEFGAEYADEWDNGEYTKADRGYPVFLNKIKNAFQAVNRAGLDMIPLVHSGDRHSRHILNTNNTRIITAPLIKTNLEVVVANKLLDEKKDELEVTTGEGDDFFPLFSPENSGGFDKSYKNLIRVIVEARSLAGLPPLEYIHIGHDEPITFESYVDKEHLVRFGFSLLDQLWIWENVPDGGVSCVGKLNFELGVVTYDCWGIPNAKAKRALMVEELTRRVNQVKEITPSTDVMIFADMWDPQHFGGYFGTASAIDELDPIVASSLIFVIWQYKDTRLAPAPIVSILDKGTRLVPIDGTPGQISAEVNTSIDATGRRYNAEIAMIHFLSKGYRIMYAWSYPDGNPHLETEDINQAFNLIDSAKTGPGTAVGLNGGNMLGYVAAQWDWEEKFHERWGYTSDPTSWQSNAPIYRQSPKFNAIEILANGARLEHRRRQEVGAHNSTFNGFLVSMPKDKISTRPDSYTIDKYEVTKLDYLMVNRNTMFPDIENIDEYKDISNYYDVLLYCNNLSMREGLIPAYIFEGEVYRQELNNKSYKNIIEELKSFRLNPTSNGYRLPKVEELQYALDTGLVEKSGPGSTEWVWKPTPDNSSAWGWVYTNGVVSGKDPSITGNGVTFRVVRSGIHSVIPPALLHNVNVNYPALGPDDVDQSLDKNRICEPGFTKGTFTIRARFENTSTDTTLSNLVFDVKELSGGPVLCNTDGTAVRDGATLVVPRQGDYSDGLLGPGEYFYQTFEVALKDYSPFTLFVDLLGIVSVDDSAPALAFIQSNLGAQQQNFELVVQEGPQLRHYWRKNDDPDFPWNKGDLFGQDVASAPALIQNRINDNLEVVYRDTNRQLRHWYRDADKIWWPGNNGIPFASDVMSAPSLIQNNLRGNGNFEVVYRDSNNQLRHWYRDADKIWWPGNNGIPFASDVMSAPSLIHSSLAGNGGFEVLYRDTNDQLRHWFRDSDKIWWAGNNGVPFASDVMSAPSLIQSNLGGKGNFEAIYRDSNSQLRHWFRNNDIVGFPWSQGHEEQAFAGGVTSAPALIQSTLGHFVETQILQSSTELSLIGVGGVLDQLYGVSNLTRISDSDSEFWINRGDPHVTVRAAFTDVSEVNLQHFGVIDESGLFRVFLAVTRPGFDPATLSNSFPSFPTFKWGIGRDPNMLDWDSQPTGNRDSADHMVAWKITGGEDRGNTVGNYVLAWEDSDDGDYNDFVIEVSNVMPSGLGNFEVIVQEGQELHHWWRNNNDPEFPWKEGNGGRPIP